ncbi:MAG: Crp/Fnr family transcriptional regulator [Betaproteobacteria bacterium RIFCSPLOWO2_12_FULL_65_110]|nr:MAG: Crp/Fnr family transcriptional regulator [Betaproteobacteria bacterium RIFCSPLOWO2_02_FULL_65_20]OGA38433.1 MAG: Crp/Fnr family transcriptional regulator [Betaproteobacteria bacterium RIFCSPLOWO2_12_FULL_65_110]
MPSTPITVRTFLANVPLFRELADEEIGRIAEQTKSLHLDRSTVLFQRGQPCEGFYVVIYGQVKLSFISKAGDEKVVDLLGPGQSFGEAVMFAEKPHVVTAQALADSMLLYVSKAAVFDELERDPRFARRMIAGLSQRLHYLMEDMEGYSMHSGIQRVIGFLLRDETEGAARESGLEVTLPAAKGVIASRLNLTQEHFSRILHELVAKGMIEVRGRTIAIRDMQKLRTYES